MTNYKPYVGIPFKEHGRDRSGLDCYGLVLLVLSEVFGIEATDHGGYAIADKPDCSRRINAAASDDEWHAVDQPKPGDVVLLNMLGFPMHCGLAIGTGLFIHANHEVGVVIERLKAPTWAKRIAGFYRHQELLNG